MQSHRPPLMPCVCGIVMSMRILVGFHIIYSFRDHDVPLFFSFHVFVKLALAGTTHTGVSSTRLTCGRGTPGPLLPQKSQYAPTAAWRFLCGSDWEWWGVDHSWLCIKTHQLFISRKNIQSFLETSRTLWSSVTSTSLSCVPIQLNMVRKSWSMSKESPIFFYLLHAIQEKNHVNLLELHFN